jgi:hypothetical protein
MLTTTPKRNPASNSNWSEVDRRRGHEPGRARDPAFLACRPWGARPAPSSVDGHAWISGLGGERRATRSCPTIPHEAEAREAEQ